MQIEMHDGLDSCAVFVVKRICNQEFEKLSRLIRLCESLKILLFSLVLLFYVWFQDRQ